MQFKYAAPLNVIREVEEGLQQLAAGSGILGRLEIGVHPTDKAYGLVAHLGMTKEKLHRVFLVYFEQIDKSLQYEVSALLFEYVDPTKFTGQDPIANFGYHVDASPGAISGTSTLSMAIYNGLVMGKPAIDILNKQPAEETSTPTLEPTVAKNLLLFIAEYLHKNKKVVTLDGSPIRKMARYGKDDCVPAPYRDAVVVGTEAAPFKVEELLAGAKKGEFLPLTFSAGPLPPEIQEGVDFSLVATDGKVYEFKFTEEPYEHSFEKLSDF